MINAVLHASGPCQYQTSVQNLQGRYTSMCVAEKTSTQHRPSPEVNRACRTRILFREYRRPAASRIAVHQTSRKSAGCCFADLARSEPASRACSSPPLWASRATCRLIEAIAAFALVAHPAMAGEIIQGTPRVADGDTLQVSEQAEPVLIQIHLLSCYFQIHVTQ